MDPSQHFYTTVGQQPKRTIPRRTLIIIGSIVAVILLIVLLVIAANAGNGLKNEEQRLNARLQALSTLSESSAPSIQDDNVQKANAELDSITLTTLASLGTSLPKPSKAIQTDEADATLTSTLQNAKLAGTFDSAYKTAIQQKLEALVALLDDISTQVKAGPLSQNLNRAVLSYTALEQEFK